jgi:protein-S-isoprenylcysteine O-methyltransferase Ste14
VLWVYFPLFLIAILVNDNFGVWKWVGMGAFAAATTVALFLYASAKEEEYLEEFR